MDLKDLIKTTWKGLDALKAAGIGFAQRSFAADITKQYVLDGRRPIAVGDDKMGRWNVDVRPFPGVPEALVAFEHAFGRPSRECSMDGERCLHWDLGNIEVVATPSYLQLTLRQPDVNVFSEPKKGTMVS